MPTTDTIAAISTAPGRAGIGIVRLSGPLARPIGDHLLHLRSPLSPGRARLARLPDPTHTDPSAPPPILDEVLATLFAAPHSYTGEDVLEIAAHGAPIILEAILRGALAHGARLANPGEFTERAFLNGRLDLAQAEAVQELIESTTLHQARVAAAQLGGSLAREIQPVKADLITLIAALEAGIDFAEDDLDLLPTPTILDHIDRITAPLRALESTFRYGQSLHAGLSLAIVGAPNTGKSSLFNALLARDRAIVTPIPGTTRDLISERLTLGGVPVELIDTAGLRDSTDPVESLGIARSRTTLAEASAILLVLDATEPIRDEDRALLASLHPRPTLVIANKLDLTGRTPAAQATLTTQLLTTQPLATPPLTTLPSETHSTPPVLALSALTLSGLDDLRTALSTLLTQQAPSQETAIVTNLRQQATITDALTTLTAAHQAAATNLPHELLLLDLHATRTNLDSLTGATTTEDLLATIFSTFCIGK